MTSPTQTDLFPVAATASTAIRFVIFSSYGNDSCALIQWAHEWGLEGVAVVYSDTGWATAAWAERVEKMEAWAQSLGFATYRTSSIGFANLAREKKGFPTQRFQWCSWRLKIEPGMRWLAEHDPEKRAICIVGVRHEEAKNPNDGRAQWPGFSPKSGNHGNRAVLAPFVEMKEEGRNALLARAGIEVLPHRSRECRCINANKADLRLFDQADIEAIAALEAEVGKTMYRPHRSMGAKGIHEIIKWAHSPRGQYEPPEEPAAVCDSMWCEQ
ncbi:phosphoadenosine phosphosulfate reductase [Methylobacterium sp. NMS14P]|uniref:phosphoadenosine phosphosulfate reductase n=1 Tax=Methylobacterium sp. NMS14P TaxID=2894310 RepID=UPI0023599703|nr:phosphoadenosine phosphosulfate reductase [Methylobacterium sp. NMS14P]WCS28168.1 phosphoadenosine phosphosulfate reductase [Methylobacterium sp. NMS14P]